MDFGLAVFQSLQYYSRFDISTPISGKPEAGWRATVDEDGHYCFAVPL